MGQQLRAYQGRILFQIVPRFFPALPVLSLGFLCWEGQRLPQSRCRGVCLVLSPPSVCSARGGRGRQHDPSDPGEGRAFIPAPSARCKETPLGLLSLPRGKETYQVACVTGACVSPSLLSNEEPSCPRPS